MASSAAHGGPVGRSASDDIKASLKDPEFRAELAARMGTTASTLSRIESGQNATSPQTVKKLADAFGARAVLGFEFGSAKHPERELVVL